MLNRSVILLTFSQVLAVTGTVLVVFIGPIIGTELAPTPSLATLSNAVLVLGVAIFTIPASFMMKRFGRRTGFVFSAGMAGAAALAAAYAISEQNFFLFCAAMLFIGGNGAFVQQYRFAAAEHVSSEQVGRAISLILLAGVVGGFLGPEIATQTKDTLPYGEFSASLLVLVVLYLLIMLLLSFLPPSPLREESASGEERPMRKILAQPTFLVAVMSGAVAYGTMTLLMTATPISMHTMAGHSLQATALVIQSHVIAMYLPSLVTGAIITRQGAPRVMGLGIMAIFLCAAINLFGTQVINYWTALVLLGIGWNFLFVGGTVLLTQSYLPRERFKAQAFNDFSVFGIQAIASLSAGTLIYLTSWSFMNIIVLPLLILMLVSTVIIARQSSPSAVSALAPSE